MGQGVRSMDVLGSWVHGCVRELVHCCVEIGYIYKGGGYMGVPGSWVDWCVRECSFMAMMLEIRVIAM